MGALLRLSFCGNGLTHHSAKTTSIGFWIEGFQQFVSGRRSCGVLPDGMAGKAFNRCSRDGLLSWLKSLATLVAALIARTVALG